MDRNARVHSPVRAFYAEHRGWRGLLVASVILTYGGGAIMFWFHAIYLGEGGPAISPWHHWLLDSTAGFIGLTPIIVFILPFAAQVARNNSDMLSVSTHHTHAGRFALVAGIVLAFVTAPAPILHDEFIGRGTWLAAQVTDLLGHHHAAIGTPQKIPEVLEMVQQVAFGIPTYVSLMWVSLMTLRALDRR